MRKKIQGVYAGLPGCVATAGTWSRAQEGSGGRPSVYCRHLANVCACSTAFPVLAAGTTGGGGGFGGGRLSKGSVPDELCWSAAYETPEEIRGRSLLNRYPRAAESPPNLPSRLPLLRDENELTTRYMHA
jgi:hypothetical protein